MASQRLKELMESGIIWIEDGTYIGMASDGVEVQLGIVGEEKRLEKYLEACPETNQW